MDDLLWLKQIQPPYRHQVGEKAFYLSYLMQKGYPVIPGFAIQSTTLRRFLETIHWLDPLFADLPNSSLHLDVDNPHQLQQVAQRLRHAITTATLPSEWASRLFAAALELDCPTLILRPSLALSSRARLDIDLKISGLLNAQVCACTAEAIATGVKQVWAELFRARSLLYWKRAGIPLQQINLAILVQPLGNAQASGYLQAHPDFWEIQATWGLGMALVRGEVRPDYYQIQPEGNAIKIRQLGKKGIAYRLSSVSNREQLVAKNGLQTYLLSEEQQKQYALEQQHLERLLQLTHRLTTELSPALGLEWVISQENEGLESQLYLTQVYPRLNTLISPKSQEQGSWASNLPSGVGENIGSVIPIIRGLGASSGQAIAKAHVIDAPIENPDKLPSGSIIVAHSITPDWFPLLQRAAGVIAEQGGMTSHIAIIARELGIPAIVGATGATELIQTGELVMIDGERGETYRIERLEAEQLRVPEAEGTRSNYRSPITSHPLPITQHAIFSTPLATQLLVNLSQTSGIEQAKSLPVDGVGLLRSEVMMLEVLEGRHPSLWLQQGRQAELLNRLSQQVCLFADAFAPHPVFYRSLDLRSHEFQALEGSAAISPTDNPMLGMRGVFSYLSNPAIFDLELAALMQVYRTGYTNVHLIVPFVRTVEEFSFCRRRVEQAGLTQYSQFQLWIMAEVPSVLLLLPDYVKAGVQGISIGTNDLTQLLLGVDRDQSVMASAFDERHPAVTRAMRELIQTAKQLGIPCSICGQAPARYPELIEPLIRWGITSMSVSTEAFEQTYLAIARAEQRLLLEAAQRQLTS